MVRPEGKLLNEYNGDARIIGITVWWRRASNREECRKFLFVAKILCVLLS
jgi:hypothetical protein